MKNLNPKKRGKLTKASKSKKVEMDRRKGSALGQLWEFENYVKERLKAMGIIQ